MTDRELKAEAGREVAALREGLQQIQAGRTQVEVADRRLAGLCEVQAARYREAVACLRELWAKLDTDAPDMAGGPLAARVQLILADEGA